MSDSKGISLRTMSSTCIALILLALVCSALYEQYDGREWFMIDDQGNRTFYDLENRDRKAVYRSGSKLSDVYDSNLGFSYHTRETEFDSDRVVSHTFTSSSGVRRWEYDGSTVYWESLDPEGNPVVPEGDTAFRRETEFTDDSRTVRRVETSWYPSGKSFETFDESNESVSITYYDIDGEIIEQPVQEVSTPVDDSAQTPDPDPVGSDSVPMQVAVRNGYALVRSDTGNGAVVASLENGTVVQYLRESHMNSDGEIWMLVDCGEDGQGWISSGYAIFKNHISIDVLPDSEPDPLLPLPGSETYHPAVITGKSVRIRKGPGTGYDTLTALSKGDAPLWLGLSAFDEQGNTWYFVCCDDMQTGWVSSKLCEIQYDPRSLPEQLLS